MSAVSLVVGCSLSLQLRRLLTGFQFFALCWSTSSPLTGTACQKGQNKIQERAVVMEEGLRTVVVVAGVDAAVDEVRSPYCW